LDHREDVINRGAYSVQQRAYFWTIALIFTAHVDEYTTSVAVDFAHDGNLMSFLIQVFLMDTYEICPYASWCVRSSDPLQNSEQIGRKRQLLPIADNHLIPDITSPNV
jgi:hypothetical protein